MTVLLTRLAVLQAAIEDTYNTPKSVGVNDGFLVENPVFTIKPNILKRNFVRNDLSPMAHIIGRKIASMEFTTELRGNGLQNSGLVANAPMIARLFQACGYNLTGSDMPSVMGPFQVGNEADPVAWTISSVATAGNIFTETSSNNFLATDTFTIGNVTYTFASSASAPNEVAVGANFAAAAANLVAAIMGTGTPGTGTYGVGTTAQTEVSAVFATTIAFTSLIAGADGNAVPCHYVASGTAAGALAGGHTTLLYGGVNDATNTDVICYYLTVTTPGVSGTAAITVTSDVVGESNTSALVTTASPFTVGTKGLTVTPVFTGSLVSGQTWVIWLMPPGLLLTPESSNFQSLTLVLHKSGVMHQMPGSFGTFDITAAAGNFATIKWVFTGTFVEPTDDPNPSPVFETTLPSQVQLARLWVNGFNAIVEKFTFNQMNDIQIRPDVSSSDGYNGVRITGRNPEGGIDPEADLVANNDFWGNFSAAQCMPYQMRVGTDVGNTIWCVAPNTQYTGLSYQDRNGILAYQAGMSFSRSLGNDEFFMFFA